MKYAEEGVLLLGAPELSIIEMRIGERLQMECVLF
jgi:hypothetical protein